MTERESLDASRSSDEPSFVAQTLAWCNEIRELKGEPPLDRLPKGDREDPASCPCGKATGLYVDNTTYGPSKDLHRAHQLPDAVVEFVRAFDGRELPQYDEHPESDEDNWDDDPEAQP